MKTFAEKSKARTVQRRDTGTSRKKDVNLIAMADHRQETPIHEHVQLMADRSLRATQLAQLQHVANSAAPNRTGLPDNLKAGIENLSGYAMDDVNVHYNSDKPAQLHAHAYAQGTDIHIASGQEKHLPHEAWHVVQQKQGRVKPTMQLKDEVQVNDNAGLEKEADEMGIQLHHGKGCGCAGCTQTLTAKEQSPLLQTSTKIAGSGVVQGKWKCSNCDTEGEGKPKKKCPECGQNTLTEVSKKQSFGDWFDSLPGERRQELLRQHGSHEAEGGGQTRKNQGGGGKGNQHSDGVANAKRQIKAKYDSGEYS